jgi:hypothetical protein
VSGSCVRLEYAYVVSFPHEPSAGDILRIARTAGYIIKMKPRMVLHSFSIYKLVNKEQICSEFQIKGIQQSLQCKVAALA